MNKIVLKLAASLLLLATSFVNLSAATITGRVWDDMNANGRQDAGEPGLSNIWVLLLDNNDVQVAGMQTNATGHYAMNNVAAGTYVLKFANPGGGYNLTYFDQGDDIGDSDADQWGLVYFTTAANETHVFDAGFTTTPLGCFTPVTISISNIKCNNNGTPCNPADDTFTFDLTAFGGTGPWGWDIPSMGIMMYPYGTPRTFGPYPVSVGSVTLTIIDHDNPDCKESVTVNAPKCTPPPSNLILTCAADETVFTDPGKSTWAANPKRPTATTTCVPNTITITQTGGPAPGTALAPGTYTFTFKAVDECCSEKTCTSRVTVKTPCDSYVQGPTIVELLDIEVGSPKRTKTYCMRVTNTGSNPLEYVAFSLPKGVVAESPADNSTYTAPSGRKYVVRNPNFSPFYSIRFKVAAGTPGLVNGQSDIFKYTLQPQVNPWNIHAIVRLTPKIFHDWYLSTADCMPAFMPGTTHADELAFENPKIESLDRGSFIQDSESLMAFPNPVRDFARLQLDAWEGQQVQVSLVNAQGQIIHEWNTIATQDYFSLDMRHLPNGLYFVRVKSNADEPQSLQIVVQH